MEQDLLRPIENDSDLQRFRAIAAKLSTAQLSAAEAGRLAVINILIENYETRRLRERFATPADAIKFYMDERSLTPRDLISAIGSRSKVSEVLSGKRSVTMGMARALHQQIGIPADLLLLEPPKPQPVSGAEPDWKRYPIRELRRRGWIAYDSDKTAEEVMTDLKARGGGCDLAQAFYRKNDDRLVNAKTDSHSIQAWCWHVLATASENRKTLGPYEKGSVTPGFMREVVQLSPYADGPLRAQQRLREHGIGLEVARHLPRTYLDGAALLTPDSKPVIGLTLRYDRIDNFWYTLLHELAHIPHLEREGALVFVEDLSLRDQAHANEYERDADDRAQNTLIPGDAWEESRIWVEPTAIEVIEFAQELGIHPAIVAGRIRYERRNYRLLSQLVGSKQVRQLFQPA